MRKIRATDVAAWAFLIGARAHVYLASVRRLSSTSMNLPYAPYVSLVIAALPRDSLTLDFLLSRRSYSQPWPPLSPTSPPPCSPSEYHFLIIAYEGQSYCSLTQELLGLLRCLGGHCSKLCFLFTALLGSLRIYVSIHMLFKSAAPSAEMTSETP